MPPKPPGDALKSAAVLFSKLMIPETGVPVTLGHVPKDDHKTHSHFMGAVVDGAWEGLKLAAGIASLLIAVIFCGCQTVKGTAGGLVCGVANAAKDGAEGVPQDAHNFWQAIISADNWIKNNLW